MDRDSASANFKVLPLWALDAESEADRRARTMCQNCAVTPQAKVPTAKKQKFFRCTGCNFALYCSKECQKAHWPTHKLTCGFYRASHDDLLLRDERARAARQETALAKIQTTPGDPATDQHPRPDPNFPLPSDFLAEIRAFTAHFAHAIFEATFSAMPLFELPQLRDLCVMWISVKRVPNPDPQSKLWSRLRVERALPCPVDDYFKIQRCSESFKKTFLESKEREARHRNSEGALSIAVTGTCFSASERFEQHFMLSLGIQCYSLDTLEITDDWEERLKTIVEKACGRDPESNEVGSESLTGQ